MGYGGWSRNGLLGIEERPLGAGNKKRALGMGTGRSGWGRCSGREQDAWNGNRALGMGTGRPEWRWGILWVDEGKAVRGAVSERCEAIERHDRAV
mgnify:CR=1 FL=1